MQASKIAGLPKPDNESVRHSQRCAEYIRARIAAAGGSISFAEFMQLALYAPQSGYYVAGATKFGRAGDFVTAPEISPLFGNVLARQCAAVLSGMAAGSILELGAGSGRLAVDVLLKLAELDALPARYEILEVSADLKERQLATIREAAPQFADRVRWLDRLPQAHRGVVIANEVLDALPVERFVVGDPLLQQRVVSRGLDFDLITAPAPAIVREAFDELDEDLRNSLPDGYVSELCLAAKPFVAEILASLESGLVFLFDYGVGQREYYARDRSSGWLRCHFRHHAHDNPLVLPGIQDITSWVNFSAIAAAAIDSGASIAGYVSQAHFLLAGGLGAELQDMAALPQQRQLELSAAVKTLTLPGEMGERFKCIGLVKGMHDTPAAFQLADRTHTL
ncbi:MAG TPA: SAM-dependent methyltransferase [Woeseiaceae bacterium]|nr:SAM-dependent methyltransferase [Woeseiaceae bacterium]